MIEEFKKRLGIIPARAGFTDRSDPHEGAGADHPRSRGVYRSRISRTVRPLGSSPLARGLLLVSTAMAAIDGIIPARAGFTLVPDKDVS